MPHTLAPRPMNECSDATGNYAASLCNVLTHGSSGAAAVLTPHCANTWSQTGNALQPRPRIARARLQG